MTSSDDDEFWLVDDTNLENESAQHQHTKHNVSGPASEPVDLLTDSHPLPQSRPQRQSMFIEAENDLADDPFSNAHSYSQSHEPDIELESLDDRTPDPSLARNHRLKHDDTPRNFDIRYLWQKYILRRHVTSDRDALHSAPRHISIMNPQESRQFRNNYVSTTKYNIMTFLPKFLFEQFCKYANLFFLATALIQQVPGVSPTNRYTTIGTLLVVLCVSAVKELAEDWKRWQGDKELNNSRIDVLDVATGEWKQQRWAILKVGDIVHVANGEFLPADVVLLSSSEPSGLCYVETANLDGETNLKIKQARQETRSLTTESRLIDHLNGAAIDCEHPNSSLYTFEGTLNRNGTPPAALGVDQMLLRGTSLRNTGWINGVVVFTGHETKLMRNATATPIKRTAVEYLMDMQILFLFVLLAAICVMGSLGNVIRLHQWRSSMWYLSLDVESGVKTFFSDILTYWILFSNLVPISLFVSIDIIKFWHGYLISGDLDMYDAANDQPAVCRTSALVEELGQIKHVFSDKTGTLTQNIMVFQACFIGDQIYAMDVPEEKENEYVKLSDDFASWNEANLMFLTVLATCHTVIPEVREDDGGIEYQASSPDEGALVEGAAKLGVKFTARTPNGLTIETPTGPQDYELLEVCEFNSTRKRMSTIMRCPDGKIRVFTKGADTVIFERLADPRGELSVTPALEDFASLGLRTLVLSQREVGEQEYADWSRRYAEANTSLTNRGERVAEIANEIEQGLDLVGVTAIEDKLQDGVPETITALQDAGIKVWVLTGDRQETAINIGMSSKLLSEDMSLLLVNESTLEDTRANLIAKLEALRGAQEQNVNGLDALALVIDGNSLYFALEPECADEFLELCCLCKAVLCCRVSPLQKALVVKLAKNRLDDLLLAIGDGANDVSMIQAAHVGVGICGVEGQQAARSADVAIAQFRFLKKLLLVHGLWSYNRLCRAILYSFYKNIALYLTEFWYVFYNGFSGQSIYESWVLTFYNVFSTALPPFAIGILDQFVSAKLLLRYPQLYRLGQRGGFLDTRQFWEWIINGIYHSIVVFWFSLATYSAGNVLTDGRIANLWTLGAAMYTACVFTTLGKAGLVTNVWSLFSVIAIIGSACFWIVGYPIYAEIGPRINVGTENRGVPENLYTTAVFWALILLVPSACLVRDIAWKYWHRMYKPEYYHYVQEIQKYKIQDRRPQMDQFQKAIRKVRQVSRMRKQRGFAFSASDEGSERVVRAYNSGKK